LHTSYVWVCEIGFFPGWQAGGRQAGDSIMHSAHARRFLDHAQCNIRFDLARMSSRKQCCRHEMKFHPI
jgi:hypothetical protein